MTDTVTVACRLPNGVRLRIFEWVEVNYPLPGGGQTKVKEAWEIPDQAFVIRGVSHEAGKDAKAPILNGFALTHNVPKDLWDKWLEQNKSLDMVKNGLIFAHAQDASIKSMSKERVDQKSGLEPLEIDEKGQLTDERRPRNPALGLDIQKADV